MNTLRLLPFVSLSLLLAVPAVAQTPLCFAIDQPVGNDNFGARSTGQTFTPSVGILPDPGVVVSLPLTQITIHQGNSGAMAPSATTYLNIYDGDPNAGGTFIGSSMNFVDTNAPVFRRPMVWSFNQLSLTSTTEYWAIMSSTDTAGTLDIAVSLETEPRNGPPGPNIYTGGAGLIANIAPHPNSVDARFEAVFSFLPLAAFTAFGNGCPGTGGTPTVSADALPQLGTSFTVECNNLPPAASSAFLLFGFTAFGVPFDLTVIGMDGCDLHVLPDFPSALPVTAGTSSFTLSIPTSENLLGLPLFYQWLVSDPGSTPAGFISSNGGQATIGC